MIKIIIIVIIIGTDRLLNVVREMQFNGGTSSNLGLSFKGNLFW